MKRPILIEFTGTPESGKTSTINSLIKLFEEEKFDVGIVTEAAARVYDNLPKDTNDYDTWVIATTTKELIEALNKQYDLIFIDRGLLDRLFWNIFTYKRGDITLEEKENRDKYITNPCIPFKSDILFVLTIPTEETIRRKGREGKFVTYENINHYNKCLKEYLDNFSKYSDTTKVVEISTLEISKEKVTQSIYTEITEFIKSKKYIDNTIN